MTGAALSSLECHLLVDTASSTPESSACYTTLSTPVQENACPSKMTSARSIRPKAQRQMTLTNAANNSELTRSCPNSSQRIRSKSEEIRTDPNKPEQDPTENGWRNLKQPKRKISRSPAKHWRSWPETAQKRVSLKPESPTIPARRPVLDTGPGPRSLSGVTT